MTVAELIAALNEHVAHGGLDPGATPVVLAVGTTEAENFTLEYADDGTVVLEAD